MKAQPINPKTNQPYRPHHLPPPTTLPLRHCSHNEDSEPIDEIECLLSLLSPSADAKKNKEHYILATADPLAKKIDRNDQQRKRKRDDEREEERAMRRSRALRVHARSIPGVPIIYVKRSVMVLEPMSTPSETVRDGVEKDKFRAGLGTEPSLDKRQREGEGEGQKKKPGFKKVKGPNPLSMKKPKKRTGDSGSVTTPKKAKPQADTGEASKESRTADVSEKMDGEDSGAARTKRRRRHHKSAPREGQEDSAPAAEAGQAMEVEA